MYSKTTSNLSPFGRTFFICEHAQSLSGKYIGFALLFHVYISLQKGNLNSILLCPYYGVRTDLKGDRYGFPYLKQSVTKLNRIRGMIKCCLLLMGQIAKYILAQCQAHVNKPWA